VELAKQTQSVAELTTILANWPVKRPTFGNFGYASVRNSPLAQDESAEAADLLPAAAAMSATQWNVEFSATAYADQRSEISNLNSQILATLWHGPCFTARRNLSRRFRKVQGG
jgi:hypothetical protein